MTERMRLRGVYFFCVKEKPAGAGDRSTSGMRSEARCSCATTERMLLAFSSSGADGAGVLAVGWFSSRSDGMASLLFSPLCSALASFAVGEGVCGRDVRSARFRRNTTRN